MPVNRSGSLSLTKQQTVKLVKTTVKKKKGSSYVSLFAVWHKGRLDTITSEASDCSGRGFTLEHERGRSRTAVMRIN